MAAASTITDRELIGLERDGAKVLSVVSSVFSVRCACGAEFTTNRRKIREKSTTLRCVDCFRAAQRDRAIENGTIFTEKSIAKVAASSPEKLFADALERVRLDPAVAELSALEQARKAALMILDEF